MTDRTAIEEMLVRAGVVRDAESEQPDTIVVAAQQGPKNLGYHGFVTVFEFTSEGALNSIGVWE